jgi:wyosine [tRNA(Phe)-imidazoG37] synthetase (radical SAM superfamily)
MSSPLEILHQRHSRHWHENKFVYPVVSRRSKGISIGVNLNPDKVCNFDCIYCQVDRRSESETPFVELPRLLGEIDEMLARGASGALFDEPEFRDLPPDRRRLNDIAFSGDGEPTTYRNFDEIIAAVADLKQRRGLDQVKLVLITNASMFHRPVVQKGLALLDQHQGEIWAKLDAGTAAYFQLVDRTRIPFQQILDNLLSAAKIRPLVIQSLFMRIHGVPPSPAEIEAYCGRLAEILRAGGAIQYVQVYTVARTPAESFVTPLEPGELESIASAVRAVGIPAETYGA